MLRMSVMFKTAGLAAALLGALLFNGGAGAAVREAPSGAEILHEAEAFAGTVGMYTVKRNFTLKRASMQAQGTVEIYRGDKLVAARTQVRERGREYRQVYAVQRVGMDADIFEYEEGLAPAADLKAGRMAEISRQALLSRRFGIIPAFEGVDFAAPEGLRLWERDVNPDHGARELTVKAGTQLRLWGMPLRSGAGLRFVPLFEPAGKYMVRLGTLPYEEARALDYGDARQAAEAWFASADAL